MAEEQGTALAFDDVRLKTGYSEVMPDKVDLTTRFSRNVPLKIPIVSAAMDTVTEYTLAIELAKLGGIGVIHRGLSPEEQAFHVSRVKHHLNGLIKKPICVYEDEIVSEVLKKREEKKYQFHSFPVLTRQEVLVGIVTGNDFDFCYDTSVPIGKIMTTNPLTAHEGTTLEEAYKLMLEGKKKVIPLADNSKKVVGLYTFSDVKRIMFGNAETYNIDSEGRLRVAAAIGVGGDTLKRVRLLVEEKVDVVVIDTAHGDTESAIRTLKEIKSNYPNLDVVVGNVSVGESALRLAQAGADGIKVGQGPGSICTTRVVAGIGRPQLSAIYSCAKALKDYDIPICADGGLRYSGDMTIAIAGGAHCLMMGSMLAGTDEAPGEIVSFQGRPWKNYRGMGSLGAMQASKAARERYGQENRSPDKVVPEGIEGSVPYKGKLADVIFQYVGGLKQGMGYVGAKTIEELREKGDFDLITPAGVKESHPHDIRGIKDAPNYKVEEA